MSTLQQSLKGKTALVTGGSRGIGSAIVRRLAAQGASISFTYTKSVEKAHELVKSIEAQQGRALAIVADSGDVNAVREAVSQTVKAFGGLDILVNNAGVAIVKSIDECSQEEFDRLVDVNIRGVFVAIQESVRHMRDGGRVINIGSIVSEYQPLPYRSLYGMTKAAVAGLTHALSRELGLRGITINNVMPGPTDTDMNPATGEHAALRREGIALKRYAHVDEIAEVVAFLASPGASYVTGTSIAVDGGYSA